MNIKSITTLGLVAVALAVTSLAPAQASNNNAALNAMAMQMYMQNQAGANNNLYTQLAANQANQLYRNSLYNNSLYNNVVSPYSTVGYVAPVSYGGCGGGLTSTYGNIVSPQYNNIAVQIANIQARLATTNPNSWTAVSLQNKLRKLQIQENSLAASGYGSPYAYNGGVLNNLGRYIHL